MNIEDLHDDDCDGIEVFSNEKKKENPPVEIKPEYTSARKHTRENVDVDSKWSKFEM